MRGVNQVLSASLLAFVLSGCDNSDTYLGGSGHGNSSPSANDLAQGNQLANAAAEGQNIRGTELVSTWRGFHPTHPPPISATLPAYLQAHMHTSTYATYPSYPPT